jgi:Leu/Phe-tRNA-protein transferase
VQAIREIRKKGRSSAGGGENGEPRPVSFGLYREGRLRAGEIGIICGKLYTSYTGYYDEDNAGTVQLVLLTRWLEENGFAFFDLGMPLPYKYDLGAIDISPEEFVELFRKARFRS